LALKSISTFSWARRGSSWKAVTTS
jgi:hypothetical protein